MTLSSIHSNFKTVFSSTFNPFEIIYIHANNLAHFFQTLYNSKKTLQYISILSKGVFLIIWKLQLSKSKICP